MRNIRNVRLVHQNAFTNYEYYTICFLFLLIKTKMTNLFIYF